MTTVQILFLLTAALILGSAVMVVSTRKILHAAAWLIVTLFGVAIIFVLLGSGFFAIIQILVYIGAIAILIIFAVMLTRRVLADTGPQVNASWPVAALAAVLAFGVLVWLLSTWGGFAGAVTPQPDHGDPVVQLGQALVSPNAYVLPFEVASVLLLSALVGAIYIAWERKEK